MGVRFKKNLLTIKTNTTMEKGVIIYNGVEYPTIDIEWSKVSDVHSDEMVTIADIELWYAMKDDYDNDVKKAVAIDNRIYYYCDSGFVASNPTEEEIIEELKDI